MTDKASVDAAARIFDGEISSYYDLLSAENFLRAILLHDDFRILRVAPKMELGPNFISYKIGRADDLTQQEQHLGKIGDYHEWLIAPEFVKFTSDQEISSTLANSPLQNQSVNKLRNEDLSSRYWNRSIQEAIFAAVTDHRFVPYFSDHRLVNAVREGFAEEFYTKVDNQWRTALASVPPLRTTIQLPPFIGIVLDRMNTRSSFDSAVRDLRNELAEVRTELLKFNALVLDQGAAGQAELERTVQEINSSFDAIVTASRIRPVELRAERVHSLVRLTKPVWTPLTALVAYYGFDIAAILSTQTSPDVETLKSRSIASSTVTGKVFTSLFKTEAVQALVQMHFSEREQALIEKSLR